MTTVAPHSIATKSFDHVALWVSEGEALTALLCDDLGMHVIERTDDFTLMGADALEGKLTLFEAPGPRDPGALERLVLRVADLDDALARLPADVEYELHGGVTTFTGPQGLGLGLVEAGGVDYDLDHVVLRVSDPEQTAERLTGLGFTRDGDSLAVRDRRLVLEPGGDGDSDAPLLNHLALLVDDVEQVRRQAEERGVEIEKVVDAENTIAIFLRGPDRLLIEYVEHKPGFSLE